MEPAYKLGLLDGPHRYPNVWARQSFDWGERLIIAPSGGHVGLMLSLASLLSEPLGVLWVLVLSRRSEHEPGRYQSPILDRTQLLEFLGTFGSFIENDARHHLWIVSIEAGERLIYDNHNVIYAYGRLDEFEAVLAEAGLTRVEDVRFPDPHAHHYHAEYDAEEVRIMDWWDWARSPLVEEHDNP